MKPIIAIPATLALVYRAWSKKSLTPVGIFAATLTAIAHAVHPWNMPFALLAVFFLAGSRVTHVKEEVKKSLTVSSAGSPGGEGPRTHVQVLANSLMASIYTLLHAYQLHKRQAAGPSSSSGDLCFAWGGDLLVVGIIANYAAVAADTFSSELGILSRGDPRLITSLTLRRVPRGTNGGVSLLGLGAGVLGSLVVVTTAGLFLPYCPAGWAPEQRRALMFGLLGWGALGSVLDSVLGGLLQRSVRDVRTGKIVEGDGGVRVLVAPGAKASAERHDAMAEVKAAALSGEGKAAVEKRESAVDDDVSDAPPAKGKYDAKNKHRRSSFGDEKPSRVVENGWDLLDNNDVNFLMAFIMSTGAMAVAGWYWGVPLQSIYEPLFS